MTHGATAPASSTLTHAETVAALRRELEGSNFYELVASATDQPKPTWLVVLESVAAVLTTLPAASALFVFYLLDDVYEDWRAGAALVYQRTLLAERNGR